MSKGKKKKKNEFYMNVREAINDEYYNDFANDGQKFLAWYLKVIRKMDEDEIKENMIIDGAYDQSIDAIIENNENNTVTFIQSKYYEKEIKRNEIQDFFQMVKNCDNLKRLQKEGNIKLKKHIKHLGDLKDKGYYFNFLFLTSSKLNKYAKSILDQNISDFKNKSISICDSEDLQLQLKQQNSPESILDWTYSYKDIKKIFYTKKSNLNCMYIVLPLEDAMNMPEIDSGGIFKSNVRCFLKFNKRPNERMQLTIEKKPENFLYLNNGITGVCKNIKIDKKKKQIKICGIDIVNGCQTLSTIFSMSESIRKNKNKGYVLLKLYQKNDLKNEIALCTNDQTQVKDIDLRSTSPQFIDLKCKYEERYNDECLIIRTGEETNKKEKIDRKALTQYIVSYFFQCPSSATKSSGKLFEEDTFKRIYDIKNPYDVEDIHGLKFLSKKIINVRSELLKDDHYEDKNDLLKKKDLIICNCLALFSKISQRFCEKKCIIKPKIFEMNFDENLLTKYIKQFLTRINSAYDTYTASGEKKITFDNWLNSVKTISYIYDTKINEILNDSREDLETIFNEQLCNKNSIELKEITE